MSDAFLSAATRALPAGTPSDIVEFFAHWMSLRRDGAVPQLSDYLDNALGHLQPFVLITDVAGPHEMRLRLMGTGLVGVVGRDATGGTIQQFYAPQIVDAVGRAVWQAMNRPAGYLCVRTVKTSDGLVLSSPSIGLPLLNPGSGEATLISYTHVDRTLAELAKRDHVVPVMDMRLTGWIDIGAGVPEPMDE